MIISRAIKKINPNAKFYIINDNIDNIHWVDNTTPISKADIQAQFTAVEFDIAMEDLRTKRNKLLADTDYLALSDQTLSAEMNTYRQQLRDLTNGLTTVEDVNNVVYPTKPQE
jgi:hypothetical protein